ncbi:MAG: hypothetical protein ACYDAS_01125 [Patescibacteria group bacterium]
MQKLKNALYQSYCDLIYTKEDLDRDLFVARINLSKYVQDFTDQRNCELNGLPTGLVGEVLDKKKGFTFRDKVLEGQYRRYVTVAVEENLYKRFSVTGSNSYKRKYKAREARLLAKSLAPSIAQYFLPSQGGPYAGKVGDIATVQLMIERFQNKKYIDVIERQLYTYRTQGYMPALDERLEVRKVNLSLNALRRREGIGAQLKTRKGLDVWETVSLEEIYSLVRGLQREDAVRAITRRYQYPTTVAETVYSKVLEKTTAVDIIEDDNGIARVTPIINDGSFHVRHFLQYILNDDKKRNKRKIFSLPKTWVMGRDVGLLMGLGFFSKDLEVNQYIRFTERNPFLKKITEEDTERYREAIKSFFSPKETSRVVGSKYSQGLFVRNTNKALFNQKRGGLRYEDYIKDFRDQTAGENIEYALNEKKERGLLSFLKNPTRIRQGSEILDTRGSLWSRYRYKKRRILKVLDFIAAIPALISLSLGFIETRLINIADRAFLGGRLTKAFIGHIEGGTLTDKLMLSFEGVRFSFNVFKLIIKDGAEIAVPALLVGILSGSLPIALAVGIPFFGLKFLKDFLPMFDAQNPLTVDIIKKIVGGMTQESLSGSEIMLKSSIFGLEAGALSIPLSLLFGVSAPLVFVGAFAAATGYKVASTFFAGRFVPSYIEASKLDASLFDILRYKSQYLGEFGAGGFITGGILTLVFGGNPIFVLTFTGVGLLSGSVADFFKNSIFEESLVHVTPTATILSDTTHIALGFGAGLGIIGFAFFGVPGAIVLGSAGTVLSVATTIIQRRFSSITVGRLDPSVLSQISKISPENIRDLIVASSSVEGARGVLLGVGLPSDVVGRILSDRFFLEDLRGIGESLKSSITLQGDYIKELLRGSLERDFFARQHLLGDIATNFRNFYDIKDLNSLEEIKHLSMGEFATRFGLDQRYAALLHSDPNFIKELEGGDILGVRNSIESTLRNSLRERFSLSQADMDKLFKESNSRMLRSLSPANLELRSYLKMSDLLKEGRALDFIGRGELAKLLNINEVDLAEHLRSVYQINIETIKYGELRDILLRDNINLISALSDRSEFFRALEGTKITMGELFGKYIEVPENLPDLLSMNFSEYLRVVADPTSLFAASWGWGDLLEKTQGDFLMNPELRAVIGDRIKELPFSLGKLAEFGRNPIVGHLNFAGIESVGMTGLWTGITVAILGVPILPAIAITGTVVIGKGLISEMVAANPLSKADMIAGRLTTFGQYKLFAKSLEGSLNVGVIGFLVGTVIGGPLVGALIGGGSMIGLMTYKYLRGPEAAIAEATKGFGAVVMHVGNEALNVTMSFSLVDQFFHLKSFIPSLFFQNGILSALGAWATVGFGIAGFAALGGAIITFVVGAAAAAFFPAVLIGAAVVITADVATRIISWLITGTSHGLLFYVGAGLKDVAGFFFGAAGSALASLGIDIIIGLIFLMSRFDFDIDDFLKTIFIMVFSWSLIAGGVFGSGVFSGSSNNNISNVAVAKNSTPASGIASNMIISPVGGKIFKISQSGTVLVSDTVYIKTQSGQVFGVKNVNNPYLYSGETITKGQFIGNVAQ